MLRIGPELEKPIWQTHMLDPCHEQNFLPPPSSIISWFWCLPSHLTSSAAVADIVDYSKCPLPKLPCQRRGTTRWSLDTRMKPSLRSPNRDLEFGKETVKASWAFSERVNFGSKVWTGWVVGRDHDTKLKMLSHLDGEGSLVFEKLVSPNDPLIVPFRTVLMSAINDSSSSLWA